MLAPIHLALASACMILVLYALYHRVTYIISSRRFTRQYGCKLPKADRHWDPILGLDFVISTVRSTLGKYQLEDHRKRFSRLAHTFKSNAVGETFIFTEEPKNLQAILATHFNDFDVGELRRQCTVKLLGHGIFNADGAFWQHSRALIRPNFARKQVADLPMLEHHVQRMMSYLPTDGTPVDIQSFFFRMTLDTATEFLFGRSIDSLRSDATAESRRFAWAFDYALSCIAQQMRLGRFYWLYRDRKYDDACSYIDDYVRPIVADAVRFRRSTSSPDGKFTSATQSTAEKPHELSEKHGDSDGEDERYIFLHSLAKETGDEKELRDQILHTLVAGRDTTASLMSSTLFVLARRADVWSKLRAEVATLNGKPPTFEEIKEMKYLRYVLHEVLRLWPVVPINMKVATKDTVLPRGGGEDESAPVLVRKGEIVAWVLYSMHRRKDIWGPDAEDFRPERWEGLSPGFSFLPFNAGPRICPGQQFALTEASYTIVRLCQTFSKIETAPGEESRPWTESLNLTCAVNGGVRVRCSR